MANNEKEILEQQGEETSENAFDEAVKFWDADDKGGDLVEDTGSEDSEEDNLDKDTEDSPNQDDDSLDDDTDVTDDEEDDEDEDDIEADYKVLYERRNRDLENLQRRLEETEQRYRSWQGRLETSNKQEPEKKETVEDVMKSEEMKNLLEYYPDLVDPVQKLINQQVKKNTDALREEIQTLMQQQVAPLAQHVYQTEAQRHEAAIKQAHPDLEKLVQTGAFESWVESLPAHQKAGAYYIVNRGSAQEIIELFNEFKQARSNKNMSSTSGKDSKAKAKPSKNSDDIVNRVKDGMHVKSQRSDVKLDDTKPEDPKKLFDEFSKMVMQEDSF